MRDAFKELVSIGTVFGVAFLLVCGLVWMGGPIEAQQSAQGETISRCGTAVPSSVAIDTTTSGNVELVALVAGERVHVCGFGFESDTATTSVQFIYGTGTACATGETDLTGPMTLLASNPIAVANGGATQFATASANALCIELGAGTQVNGWVTYVQH